MKLPVNPILIRSIEVTPSIIEPAGNITNSGYSPRNRLKDSRNCCRRPVPCIEQAVPVLQLVLQFRKERHILMIHIYNRNLIGSEREYPCNGKSRYHNQYRQKKNAARACLLSVIVDITFFFNIDRSSLCFQIHSPYIFSD